MNTLSLPVLQRSCGDCSKCCEGWLEANIHGHYMHAGKPCHYLDSGKGCSIYENRPEDICKAYTCVWLDGDELPLWMKPSKSNVIVTTKYLEEPGIPYYQIVEAGKKIDSAVLNWIVHWALRSQINICYEVEGKRHTIGSEEFVEAYG